MAAGDELYGQCDVEGWTGIVLIAAGYYHTLGLKSDGTVSATGSNYAGQCDVGDWLLGNDAGSVIIPTISILLFDGGS